MWANATWSDAAELQQETTMLNAKSMTNAFVVVAVAVGTVADYEALKATGSNADGVAVAVVVASERRRGRECSLARRVSTARQNCNTTRCPHRPGNSESTQPFRDSWLPAH